jgi:hypothetical protein
VKYLIRNIWWRFGYIPCLCWTCSWYLDARCSCFVAAFFPELSGCLRVDEWHLKTNPATALVSPGRFYFLYSCVWRIECWFFELVICVCIKQSWFWGIFISIYERHNLLTTLMLFFCESRQCWLLVCCVSTGCKFGLVASQHLINSIYCMFCSARDDCDEAFRDNWMVSPEVWLIPDLSARPYAQFALQTGNWWHENIIWHLWCNDCILYGKKFVLHQLSCSVTLRSLWIALV